MPGVGVQQYGLRNSIGEQMSWSGKEIQGYSSSTGLHGCRCSTGVQVYRSSTGV